MKVLEPIFLPHPIGFYNTGSICYFNSLLQVLLSCTSLKYWNIKSNNALEIMFKNIINENNQNSLSSNELLNLLKKNNITFGNGQESASEALMLLLNSINNNELNNLFIHRFKYVIKCLSCSYITDEIIDHSILFETFHMEKFNIDNILNQVSQLIDYKCSKCNKSNAIKISRLTMLPEIIIFLFNVYHEKKINNFPMYLEFPGINNNILKYMIIGQVEHFGSLHGGHYCARAIRNDGIYLFNDNIFSRSIIEPTINTYLIFYHLIEQ